MNFLAVLIALLVTLILYKKIYFKPVTGVRLYLDGSTAVTSFKPNNAWFRSFGSGRAVGVVRLSSDILAVYTVTDTIHPLLYKSSRFYSDVVLIRYSRLRFRSVELSDRVLNDCISNFTIVD